MARGTMQSIYLYTYAMRRRMNKDSSWLKRCNSSWSPTALLKWGKFCSNWNSTFLWCSYIFLACNTCKWGVDIYNPWAEYQHNATVRVGNGYFEWSQKSRNFCPSLKEAATLGPHYFSLSQGCPNSEPCNGTNTHCPVPKHTLGDSYLLSLLCLYSALLFFFRPT